MSLFTKNGRPLKFCLIGLPEETEAELRKLIIVNGGQVSDSEEPLIIRFTTPESYVKGKTMFDVQFIRECVQKRSLMDLDRFKLGERDGYEGCIMSLLIYGTPHCMFTHVSEPDICLDTRTGTEITETCNMQNSQHSTNNSKKPLATSSQRTVPNHARETSPANEPESSETTMNKGGGDISDQPQTRASDDNKRPCHIEYETEVAPKMRVWKMLQKRKQRQSSCSGVPASKSKLNRNSLSRSLEETNDYLFGSPDEPESRNSLRNQKPAGKATRSNKRQKKIANEIIDRSEAPEDAANAETDDGLLQRAAEKPVTSGRGKATDVPQEKTKHLNDWTENSSSVNSKEKSTVNTLEDDKLDDASYCNSGSLFSGSSGDEAESSDDNLHRSSRLLSRCSTKATEKKAKNKSLATVKRTKAVPSQNDAEVPKKVGDSPKKSTFTHDSDTNRDKSPILSSRGQNMLDAKYYLENSVPLRGLKNLSKRSKRNEKQTIRNDNDSKQSKAHDSADKKLSEDMNNSAKQKESHGVGKRRSGQNEGEASIVENSKKPSKAQDSDDVQLSRNRPNSASKEKKTRDISDKKSPEVKKQKLSTNKRNLNKCMKSRSRTEGSSDSESGDDDAPRREDRKDSKKSQGVRDRKSSGKRAQKSEGPMKPNLNKSQKPHTKNRSSRASESNDDDTTQKHTREPKKLSKTSKPTPDQYTINNNDMNQSGGSFNNSPVRKESQSLGDRNSSIKETRKAAGLKHKSNVSELSNSRRKDASSGGSDSDDNAAQVRERDKSDGRSKTHKSVKTVPRNRKTSKEKNGDESLSKDGGVKISTKPKDSERKDSAPRKRASAESAPEKSPSNGASSRKYRKLYAPSPETCLGKDLSPASFIPDSDPDDKAGWTDASKKKGAAKGLGETPRYNRTRENGSLNRRKEPAKENVIDGSACVDCASPEPGTSKRDANSWEENSQPLITIYDSDSESSVGVNAKAMRGRVHTGNRRLSCISSDDSSDEMQKNEISRGRAVHRRYLKSVLRNSKKLAKRSDKRAVRYDTSASSGDASEHVEDSDDSTENLRNNRKRSKYSTIDVEVQGSSSKKPQKSYATRNISLGEQIDMVNYLIEVDGIASARGISIWKQYVREKNTRRTFWSLWENFRKSILPKIEYFRMTKASLNQFKKLRC